jgi:hypothetical protein
MIGGFEDLRESHDVSVLKVDVHGGASIASRLVKSDERLGDLIERLKMRNGRGLRAWEP